MELHITQAVVREAALVNLLDLIEDNTSREKIRSELWCLRNGIDTEGLHDVTTAGIPTKTIIDAVMTAPQFSKHEHAARLLCTIRELS